jgi:hypothetical protein
MKWSDTGGKEFEQAAAGNHVARCVGMIDIGTHQSDYQGKTTYARKVILRFELPNEVMQDGEWAGKPFIVSKYYTASLSEKANLRRDLESWRGRPFTETELMGFDSKNVLDKPCMVNVVHTEKGKAKIASITPIPKGLEVPPRVNDILYLSLDRSEFKREVFDGLSDYWKGEIMKSPEWAELQDKPAKRVPKNFEDMDDSIPF